MVYCGKASLSCQNCRTRRIKCNKARPECSQCVRAGKQCAGYRTRLEVMFRDESSKVMQRAHAKWGREDNEGHDRPDGPSAVTPPLQPNPSSSNHQSPSTTTLSPASAAPVSGWKAVNNVAPEPGQVALMVKPLGPTWAEQGVQFYINRYVLGYGDDPKCPEDLHDGRLVFDPAVQDIMAAIGLIAMSNLTGDGDTKLAARQNYVLALRQLGGSLTNLDTVRMDVTLRSVVLLALFEVVKTTHETTKSAQAHIMGAAALVRSLLPVREFPATGLRGLVQLCYALLVPTLFSGAALPSAFPGWVSLAGQAVPAEERPAAALLAIISRFPQLSEKIRAGPGPESEAIDMALQQLDSDLEAWALGAEGKWQVSTRQDGSLPRAACFRGKYHLYADMAVARVWSYYRWARILVNQSMLESLDQQPQPPGSFSPSLSAARVVLTAQQRRRRRCLDTIVRLAEDILVSVPSHWKHPALSPAQRSRVCSPDGGGTGSAGVPPTLFHLTAAATAPGVPYEFWRWSLDALGTVWASMGMLQAKTLSQVLRKQDFRLKEEQEMIARCGPLQK